MTQDLKNTNIHRLLWQLSIPAILGMLSSAIFNLVDRIFVGKISTTALTAVGITMPIQVLQMAFVLLIGIGSSSLISIKLGENKKEEAEYILMMAFKGIVLFLIAFAILFLIFLEPILSLLAIPEEVIPDAKIYIIIIIVGSIIGIPGYCLNNSLRSIGQAKISMNIILITSILNIILDPIFIFGFGLGIAGAAIATVISQTILTIYVVWVFCKRDDFMIHLRFAKTSIQNRKHLVMSSLSMGLPSFYVQILATVVSLFINRSILKYGTDLDIAAITIISSIFSFYHMVIFGLVQGNNAICGYNWGAKQYKRVKRSLSLSMGYAFGLSTLLFVIIQVWPHVFVDFFTNDAILAEKSAHGIRLYLAMLPLLGLQTIGAQYFQAVGKAKLSSQLSFLRYGLIVIPSILLLAPRYGSDGIYISNAISDGIASVVAILFVWKEYLHLNRLVQENVDRD